MKLSYKWVTLLLGGTILLSGCGLGNVTSNSTSSNQEKTASVKTLPTFLHNQTIEVAQVYQIASQNMQVLKYIPCYCGCAESVGHKSNRDCFIKDVETDGSVVWDKHATNCNVCLDIATQAAKMKKVGKSIKEIRNYIDNKYKEGYSKPTPTPTPTPIPE